MPILSSKPLCAGILLSLCLQGCNLLPGGPDYSAWEGHTVEELTDSWGAPGNERELSADSVALTWQDRKYACDITFFAREGRITGYSDTGC